MIDKVCFAQWYELLHEGVREVALFDAVPGFCFSSATRYWWLTMFYLFDFLFIFRSVFVLFVYTFSSLF